MGRSFKPKFENYLLKKENKNEKQINETTEYKQRKRHQSSAMILKNIHE